MNNLAGPYMKVGRTEDALTMLKETMSRRQKLLSAEPENHTQQKLVAWTHGQIGEAEQFRHDYVAAMNAYATSVEMFGRLAQVGELKPPFFRHKLTEYREQLALCQKAEQAVRDLDFVLKRPAPEASQLLDLRVRYLLAKEQNIPAAILSAAKAKERAGSDAGRLYAAACLYALCAAAAKPPAADAARLAKDSAEHAMTLLTRAVLKGYTNAAHMKQDLDLEILRSRPDFQRLIAELEAKR